jgi:hypothetical protein
LFFSYNAIYFPLTLRKSYRFFEKGFCCEIDENCGEVEPYITDMENCLTFGHEYINFDHKDYFESGSHARKIVYHREEKKKKKKKRKKEEK